MQNIETRIVSRGGYTNNVPVELVFELTNRSNEDIRVLKWDTPLEGLRSDCLYVTVNGHKVEYDGLFLKRGTPQAEDYLVVRAGDTVTHSIILDEAYDVSEAGNYEVVFDKSKLIVLPEHEFEGDFNEKAANAPAPEVAVQPGVFNIEQAEQPRMTIGQQMRDENSKKKVTTEADEVTAAGAKKPLFTGGTDAQKEIVQKAHDKGYSLAVAAPGQTGDNDKFKTWFGAFDAGRQATVKNNYEKISKRMESTQFTYDLTGQGCRANTYAYTTKGGSTVWLCSLFWNAPAIGIDSQAGTIVHEHSHATASTDDIVYGQTKCKQLAKDTPDKAVKNADNHEYFVES